MIPKKIRLRPTIVHLIFGWLDDMKEKQIEDMVIAISCAFLFPFVDEKES